MLYWAPINGEVALGHRLFKSQQLAKSISRNPFTLSEWIRGFYDSFLLDQGCLSDHLTNPQNLFLGQNFFSHFNIFFNALLFLCWRNILRARYYIQILHMSAMGCWISLIHIDFSGSRGWSIPCRIQPLVCIAYSVSAMSLQSLIYTCSLCCSCSTICKKIAG